MMRIPTCVLFLGLAAAPPGLAQEAQKLDLTFTWSAVDLEAQPAEAGRVTSIGTSELVFTGEGASPFDKAVGHCLYLRRLDPATQGYGAEGDCQLADAEGDRAFLRFSEENGEGRGALTGGTGKFAGLASEFAYELPWFGSPGEGRNAGRGRLTGTWMKSAP